MPILILLSSFFSPQAMNLLKPRNDHKKKNNHPLYKNHNNLEKREAQGEKLCCKDINPCKESQEASRLRMELRLNDLLCTLKPLELSSLARSVVERGHSRATCGLYAVAAPPGLVMPFHCQAVLFPLTLLMPDRRDVVPSRSPLGTVLPHVLFLTFYFTSSDI